MICEDKIFILYLYYFNIIFKLLIETIKAITSDYSIFYKHCIPFEI